MPQAGEFAASRTLMVRSMLQACVSNHQARNAVRPTAGCGAGRARGFMVRDARQCALLTMRVWRIPVLHGEEHAAGMRLEPSSQERSPSNSWMWRRPCLWLHGSRRALMRAPHHEGLAYYRSVMVRSMLQACGFVHHGPSQGGAYRRHPGSLYHEASW
jgi:hypothetical protein